MQAPPSAKLVLQRLDALAETHRRIMDAKGLTNGSLTLPLSKHGFIDCARPLRHKTQHSVARQLWHVACLQPTNVEWLPHASDMDNGPAARPSDSLIPVSATAGKLAKCYGKSQ